MRGTWRGLPEFLNSSQRRKRSEEGGKRSNRCFVTFVAFCRILPGSIRPISFANWSLHPSEFRQNLFARDLRNGPPRSRAAAAHL